MNACSGAEKGLLSTGEPRSHTVSAEPPDVRRAVPVVAVDEESSPFAATGSLCGGGAEKV